MKSFFPLAALFVSLCALPTHAENVIRVSAPIAKSSTPVVTPPEVIQPEVPTEQWIADAPVYSAWVDTGDLYGCSSASPDASGLSVNVSFTQTYASCKQDQTRTVQPTVKSSLTGEVKNIGDPTTETQTLSGLSGTRTTQGTNNSGVMTYAISPGSSSGLGAGYYKQNGGGYNFGTSMQKTANGYQTYFAVIYYNGVYSIQFGASTGSAMNASLSTKYDSSPYAPYITPYKGMRLLKSDNTVLYEYNFTNISDVRNYILRTAILTSAQYNAIYSNISQVAKIQLFE